MTMIDSQKLKQNNTKLIQTDWQTDSKFNDLLAVYRYKPNIPQAFCK